MRLAIDDTIVAVASAAGGGARGIIRVSGRGVTEIIGPLFQADDPLWTEANGARRWTGHWGEPGVPVAVYFWPDERSYTGERLAEIHVPGSSVLLERMLGEILAQGGRAARRGEFTLRAFLAGKLDLVQAEGVLGVIEATDADELGRGLAQLAGGISKGLTGVRQDLLNLLADLEAGLDFTDEGLTFVPAEEVLRRMDSGIRYLEKLLAQSANRFTSGELPEVMIVGPANAGKSTLFNVLAGVGAAIVSAHPGTTRDLISREVIFSTGRTSGRKEGSGELCVRLFDSAGEEAEAAELIRTGLALRDEQLRRARLILRCRRAEEWPATGERLTDAGFPEERTIRIATQCDRLTEGSEAEKRLKSSGILTISALTGVGMQDLIRAIGERIQGVSGEEQLLGTTAARCRHSLQSAIENLERAQGLTAEGAGDELVTEELRGALQSLGEVTGEVSTDDVLDRIFSRFCIGK